MPNVHDLWPSSWRTGGGRSRAALLLGIFGLLAASQAPAALAAPAPKPSVPAPFKITKVANAPGGAANCDDLGYLDGDGFLHLVARQREVIIRGGVNIAPLEIDEIMLKHPGVLDAAAVRRLERRAPGRGGPGRPAGQVARARGAAGPG